MIKVNNKLRLNERTLPAGEFRKCSGNEWIAVSDDILNQYPPAK